MGRSVNQRYTRANLGPVHFVKVGGKSLQRVTTWACSTEEPSRSLDKDLCQLTVRSGGLSSARWHLCSRIEGITSRVLVYYVHVKIYDTKIVLPISFIATSDNGLMSGTHIFNTNSEYIFKQEPRLRGFPAGKVNGKRRSVVCLLRKVELKGKCKYTEYTEYLKDNLLWTTKRSLW